MPFGYAEDVKGIYATHSSRERSLRAEQGEAAIELLAQLGVTPAMLTALTDVWIDSGDMVATLTALQEGTNETVALEQTAPTAQHL